MSGDAFQPIDAPALPGIPAEDGDGSVPPEPLAEAAPDGAPPVPPPPEPFDDYGEDEAVDVRAKDRDPKSLSHLMTHFPFNPLCEVCVRANKNRVAHRRRKLEREQKAKKFGELITMDFLSNHRDKLEGINSETEALITLDHYTGWIQIFP